MLQLWELQHVTLSDDITTQLQASVVYLNRCRVKYYRVDM